MLAFWGKPQGVCISQPFSNHCLSDHFTGISPYSLQEVGSVMWIGCDSSIRRTNGLQSPPKDLTMRIKRLAKGCYSCGRIQTHAGTSSMEVRDLHWHLDLSAMTAPGEKDLISIDNFFSWTLHFCWKFSLCFYYCGCLTCLHRTSTRWKY